MSKSEGEERQRALTCYYRQTKVLKRTLETIVAMYNSRCEEQGNAGRMKQEAENGLIRARRLDYKNCNSRVLGSGNKKD